MQFPRVLDIDSTAYRLLTGQLIYRYFFVESFGFLSCSVPILGEVRCPGSAFSRLRMTSCQGGQLSLL
jgi:hypothetical protein